VNPASIQILPGLFLAHNPSSKKKNNDALLAAKHTKAGPMVCKSVLTAPSQFAAAPLQPLVALARANERL
jgi:hypothetical protein